MDMMMMMMMIMSKTRMLMHFQPLIIVLGFSVSYFLEMVMPIK